jgi:hypothetical protein
VGDLLRPRGSSERDPRVAQLRLNSPIGGEPDPSNNALSLPIELIPAFASFEDPTDPWVRSWTAPPQGATLADQGSDGAHSLSLSCGYASYDSPTFDTTEWEVIGTELWVDVLVPLAQSNPYWVGDLQLFFDLRRQASTTRDGASGTDVPRPRRMDHGELRGAGRRRGALPATSRTHACGSPATSAPASLQCSWTTCASAAAHAPLAVPR